VRYDAVNAMLLHEFLKGTPESVPSSSGVANLPAVPSEGYRQRRTSSSIASEKTRVQWPPPSFRAISIDRRAPKPLSLLANQPPQRLLIRRQKLGDPLVVDVGDDDLADLGVDLAEDAVRPHLCDLVLVVLGGGDVVHRVRLEAVHQEEVDEGH